MNYYITGDTHGDFKRISYFCNRLQTSKENDVMIILGDAGINYQMLNIPKKSYHYEDSTQNIYFKKSLDKIPITFFIIQGNHEAPAWHCKDYKEKEWCGGTVFYQEEFPNLLFAKTGEIYHFNEQSVLVLGGAYSVDKFYRLHNNLRWFPEEQPTEEMKKECETILKKHNWCINIVLSHTCPYKYIPKEMFLPQVSQKSVDNSTEKWLDLIEDRLEYDKWFCGHWHTDKIVDKINFMFDSMTSLDCL